MSEGAAEAAFEEFMENMGEDDADDLMTLAETSFYAGWDACRAWMTGPASEPED